MAGRMAGRNRNTAASSARARATASTLSSRFTRLLRRMIISSTKMSS